MNRRYRMLFAGIVTAALLLTLIGRLPRSPRAVGEAEPAAPRWTLEIVVEDGQVLPAVTQVEKDHQVDLIVLHRGTAAANITLLGYEDRIALHLEPGDRDSVSFLADRPGEGFAWLVNGEPAGRLVVAGAHLAEGRR